MRHCDRLIPSRQETKRLRATPIQFARPLFLLQMLRMNQSSQPDLCSCSLPAIFLPQCGQMTSRHRISSVKPAATIPEEGTSRPRLTSAVNRGATDTSTLTVLKE